MDANVESLKNLVDNLKSAGYDLKTMAYVLQLNKRDMPTAVPVEEMTRVLRYKDEEIFEGVAVKGAGVFETLKALAKLVLVELKKAK